MRSLGGGRRAAAGAGAGRGRGWGRRGVTGLKGGSGWEGLVSVRAELLAYPSIHPSIHPSILPSFLFSIRSLMPRSICFVPGVGDMMVSRTGKVPVLRNLIAKLGEGERKST